MIELVLGTYGALCWFLFRKWKIIPTNTYTVCTAILLGVAFLAVGALILIRYQPASNDGRLYVITTPIVPEVRGIVTEVLVDPSKTVKLGDPLFQINPVPYRYEVQRLEASLAAASTNTSQLEQKASAAGSTVAQAQANINRIRSELKLADAQLTRYSELMQRQLVAQVDYDRRKQQAEELRAQLAQATAAKSQAEAQEKDVRLGLDTNVDGQTPAVRQIVAQLGTARFNLEQTTVRAPGDGYVTQMVLRPGQMATNMPFAPLMIFVHESDNTLVASFPQNVVALLEPDLEAELAFKAYPGRIFKAKLSKVLPAAAEGQLIASGNLRTVTPERAPGRIPVVFSYGADVEALNLPAGSQAIVAVYTKHFHVASAVRKIILRIKSWENFLFLP